MPIWIPNTGIVPPNNAGGLVNSNLGALLSFGSSAFGIAQDLIGQLANLPIEPIGISHTFNPPTAILSPFVAPIPPDAPDLSFEVDIPSAPGVIPATIPNFGSPPSFTATAPVLNLGGRPGPFVGILPTKPELFPIELPDDPGDLVFPEVPTFEELNLPDPPEIVDIDFDGQRPVFDAPLPDISLDFTEPEYQSELLDKTQAEVARMLEGGTGLPPDIEQMIFDRARAREDRNGSRAVQEAIEDWASRGFSLPSGVVDQKVRQARQTNQEQSNAFSRETMIRVHEVEVENLRFAVQQGIALENILIQAHLAAAERAFQVARTTVELAFNLFRARVEVYNAEVQAYRIDAEVYRELIRAQLAKVEVYRAQIEGERVRGEINLQRVQLYTAQLQGIQTLVEVYRTRVQAVQTIAQTNQTIIQGFAAEIQAFTAQVGAKEAEFRAWAAGIQGELGKVQAFQAESNAFMARVQGYAAGVQAQAVGPDIHIRGEALKLQGFNAELEAIRTQIMAESERIRGHASIYGGQASIYAASGQVAMSQTEASNRMFQTLLESSRLTSEFHLRESELNVSQLLSLTQQRVGALTGAANAAAGLASSALSAINVGASISDSYSGSAGVSWSTTAFD